MTPAHRHVSVKKVLRGRQEAAASRAFWRGLTGEQRVGLLWDMVLEARVWQGLDGDQPRLQRSVCVLRRR
jgi:hypothetical protein